MKTPEQLLGQIEYQNNKILYHQNKIQYLENELKKQGVYPPSNEKDITPLNDTVMLT